MNISDEVIERMLQQFSVLVEGHSSGRMGGERTMQRLTTGWTGSQWSAMTIISNLPELPYGSDPTRLVQHAVVNWLYVLTQLMANKDPRIEALSRTFEWELKMRQDQQDREQYQTFLQFLKSRASDLASSHDPLGDVQDIIEQASSAPQRIRVRCTQAVVDDADVRRAINALSDSDAKDRITSWMEPWLE